MNLYQKLKKLVELDFKYEIKFNLTESEKKESLNELNLDLGIKDTTLKFTYQDWENIEYPRKENGKLDNDQIIIDGDKLKLTTRTSGFQFRFNIQNEIEMKGSNDRLYHKLLSNNCDNSNKIIIQTSGTYGTCNLNNENFSWVIENLHLERKELKELFDINFDYKIENDIYYMKIIDTLIDLDKYLIKTIQKKEKITSKTNTKVLV